MDALSTVLSGAGIESAGGFSMWLLGQSVSGPMGSATLSHYLFIAAALFALGMVGFLSRRNLIIMFLCTEIMFQGVVVALAAFSRRWMDPSGEVFVVFVLTIAAAEAALALGLVVYLFRRKHTLDAQAWAELKG